MSINKSVQLGLTNELRKLANNLPDTIDTSLPREGWKVNSHTLTLAGEKVIVSILLQRLRN